MDIQQEINSIKSNIEKEVQRLKELEDQFKKDNEKEVYKDGLLQPKDGKKYYWNNSLSEDIENDSYWVNKDDFNSFLVNNGLVFLTNEEAEVHQKKLLAFAKCLSVQKNLNGDWKPNWNDYSDRKYYPHYNFKDSEFEVDWKSQHLSENFYFQSKDIAEQFIELCKSELEILFNIKEQL
jgi:hypothetical protein